MVLPALETAFFIGPCSSMTDEVNGFHVAFLSVQKGWLPSYRKTSLFPRLVFDWKILPWAGSPLCSFDVFARTGIDTKHIAFVDEQRDFYHIAVSMVAFLLPPVAVSPLMPGSVSTTVSSTVFGSSTPRIRLSKEEILTFIFSFRKFIALPS